MFVETIDKLIAEFQQRLDTKTSIPWGWFFSKLASLLARYPTGITKAIMLAELECAWRKIEKLQTKGGISSADSLRSIVLSKHLDPQAVFEVLIKEVKVVEGTQTQIAVVDDPEFSSSDFSFTIEMYLHQKLYAEVDEIMARGYNLKLTGCRSFNDHKKRLLRLLPSENFLVLVDARAVESFDQKFTMLEGVFYLIILQLGQQTSYLGLTHQIFYYSGKLVYKA